MSTVPFHYVDVRTFCYATEDEQRVRAALSTLVPEDAQIDRAETEGHHGDRILVLSTRLERAEEIRHVLGALEALGAEQREGLQAELTERVDEDCSFFLTLSKQAAFEGDVERGDGITVRGKVEVYPAEKERAVETVRAAFEEQ